MKKKRTVFPLRSSQVLEERPLSDRLRLSYEPFMASQREMLGVVQALLGRQNEIMGRLLLMLEGLNPEEGWRLDLDRGCFRKVPLPPPGSST